MEIIITYIAFATISIVFAGAVLLLIDHYLESIRINKMMIAAEQHFIPAICKDAKQMSIDTIRAINDELYNQFKEDEG